MSKNYKWVVKFQNNEAATSGSVEASAGSIHVAIALVEKMFPGSVVYSARRRLLG